MKQTDNLKLNLFENSDPVLAQYFNENSTKLDAAITEAKALTEARYNANKQSTDALAAKTVTVQTGTFTGNGESTLTVSFNRPAAVVILQYSSNTLLCIRGRSYGVGHLPASGFGGNFFIPGLTWSSDGKTLTMTGLTNSGTMPNLSNTEHFWMAFLCDEISN